MNDILYCFVLGQVCIIAIWHMGVSVNQGLICTSSYEHVFGTLHFCPDNCDVHISGRGVVPL